LTIFQKQDEYIKREDKTLASQTPGHKHKRKMGQQEYKNPQGKMVTCELEPFYIFPPGGKISSPSLGTFHLDFQIGKEKRDN
jgi:hypothetical protein